MRPSVRRALIAALLAVPACELVDFTVILDDEDYDPDWNGSLAVSEDGERLWVDHQKFVDEDALKAFANPSGDVLQTIDLFSGELAIADLAAAHEPGSEGSVWALHETGLRTRWNENGSLTGFAFPDTIEAAFPAEGRQWCGLVMGLDGAAYLMSSHENGYAHWHLYREKDGIVTRTEGPFSSFYCPQIAYDLAVDEVAVAIDHGSGSRDIYWFDPETMDETHSIEFVARPQAIAVFNHKAAVGTESFIRVWNADGTSSDEEWGIDVHDLDVQYGGNMVRLWWSGLGPDDSTVGWFRLD